MRIKGNVISGKNKGEKIGFPTINLAIGEEYASIMNPGVYAGKVFLGSQEKKAAIFIDSEKKILEAHILDFSGNLRGQNVEVELGVKLREVEKFNSDEELVEQIKSDIGRVT
ncbi:MAG: riboflavin kinase [uncultured bacterium]|nr:MAG: riboflavin kinase [uncultured bacterium]